MLTREQALSRFMAAVRDGRSGQFDKAKEIVERVRQMSGDEAAEIAKKEIWKYVKSEKPA